jgi:hypothetical protein
MDTVIPAGGKGLVKTDLSIAIPRDTYARVGQSWIVSGKAADGCVGGDGWESVVMEGRMHVFSRAHVCHVHGGH